MTDQESGNALGLRREKDDSLARPMREYILWRIAQVIALCLAASAYFIFAIAEIDSWIIVILLNIVLCVVVLGRLLWRAITTAKDRRRWVFELVLFAVLLGVAYANSMNAYWLGRKIVFSRYEGVLEEFADEIKSIVPNSEMNGSLVRVAVPRELADLVQEAWAIRYPDESLYLELVSGHMRPSARAGFVYVSDRAVVNRLDFQSRWNFKRKVADDWWTTFG